MTTRDEKKEFLLKLKRISKEIVHWEEKLISESESGYYSDLVQFELKEQVDEIFGDTRDITLTIDGNDIMAWVGYDWDDPDADDPEKQEDFYYESLETNRTLLKELSDNILKFIEIIEKELKE